MPAYFGNLSNFEIGTQLSNFHTAQRHFKITKCGVHVHKQQIISIFIHCSAEQIHTLILDASVVKVYQDHSVAGDLKKPSKPTLPLLLQEMVSISPTFSICLHNSFS